MSDKFSKFAGRFVDSKILAILAVITAFVYGMMAYDVLSFIKTVFKTYVWPN